jgi:pyruvate-ferredoxin/flavodoxin oxidoreductase
VCPHAAIRVKIYPTELLANAPEGFKSTASKTAHGRRLLLDRSGSARRLHRLRLVRPELPGKDRTDPTRKAINLRPQPPIREKEIKNWDYFLSLPLLDRTTISPI